jgi:hypothetical protein
MSRLAWLANKISAKHIERATARHLDALARDRVRTSERIAREMLEKFRNEPGPHVCLGETSWGEPVSIPLRELANAYGIVTGGMGTGKSMTGCAIVQAIVQSLPRSRSVAFGCLDAKGELFERAVYLLSARLEELQGEARQELLDRIVIIDFSSQAVSPYNILSRWKNVDADFFVNSRLETLRDLLPAGDKLSLRGAAVLKSALALLSEFGLPLTYLNRVLESDGLREKLVARSENPETRLYFGRHFAQESKATIAALRTRMDSLCASDGVRLALSGPTAPDFRKLQNEGKIVLINCAGSSISRGVRLLLQGLVISDIRAGIFARPNNPPVNYLWLADEAQNFFLTRQQQEDMVDILTMARSFGTFFCFLCQNISTAVPDARFLEQLHTNTRWSLTLRGTPRDAQFLRAALPVTGRRLRPESHPFRERTFSSSEEERSVLWEGIASLPDREGYLWLKPRAREAIRIRTRKIELPTGEEFREKVAALRDDHNLGGRLSRSEYRRLIDERDREWLEERHEVNLIERLEKKYSEERTAWQP